jgi:hypothetical protein
MGKQFARPYLENIQNKIWAGGVAQVIESLSRRDPAFKPQLKKNKFFFLKSIFLVYIFPE